MTARTSADLRFTMAATFAAQVGTREAWERLFHWIDQRGFFADQVTHFASRDGERRGVAAPVEGPGAVSVGVFERLATDLERQVLPATVELRDWERFLHYLLVAANLRGMAEALAEPEILGALARSGREAFARELAARLSAVDARVSALAATLEGLSSRRTTDLFASLVRDLADDIDGAPIPGTAAEAEARCQALVEVGRRVAPEYRRRWPTWIEALKPWPELADRAWLAVAEGYLGCDDEPDLWEALGSVQDDIAVQRLLERCADRRVGDPRSWVSQTAIRRGTEEAWRVALAAMAARADGDGGEPSSLWQWALTELGPPAWSGELVDHGCRTWARLSEDQAATALAEIRDPEAEVALLVARWSAGATDETAARLRAAIDRIPEPEPRLFRLLSFLWADRAGPRRASHRRRLADLARQLDRDAGGVAERSLVLFLDLLGELDPRTLRRELESLLSPPVGTSALLRALAGQAESATVQAEILERAERYASLVAETEAEGFALRREVIVRLTCRRSVAAGDPKLPGELTDRLLPEEEDELRSRLVVGLVERGAEEAAGEVAAGISDRRLRFISVLRAHRGRPVPDDLLEPLSLYEVAADVATVTDELASLGALRQVPADPEAVAASCLRSIARPGRRIEALVDLGWQALLYQRRFPPRRQDLTAAVLPLRDALGVVESDDWLLALAPELVEIGSQLGARECLSELQEAIERIVQLDAAPWRRRREAIEAVVSSLPRLIAVPWPGVPAGHPTRHRTAVRFLRWLSSLPESLPKGPGREALRRDWGRVVAWIAAVRDRLPAGDAGIEARCGDDLETRVYLLSGPDPDAAASLWQQAREEADGDDLGLRLVRHGWLSGAPAERVAASIRGEAARRRARVWVEAWREAEPQTGFVESLATAVAAGDWAATDPSYRRLRARLQASARDEALPILARAAIAGLAAGGKATAQAAACWFLAAALPPVWSSPGAPDAELAGLEAAARRSARLRVSP